MPTIVDSIETLETNIWIWHRNVVNSTNSTNVWHLIELLEAGVVWCVGSVVEDGWRTAGSLVTWPGLCPHLIVEAGLQQLHSPGHS